MRFVSLFSGIEAASVAFGPLGWEAVAFSEIDPFPCAVLQHRFPGVPNLGDIRNIDWRQFNEQYGAVDIVVGGSPCQSFSVAGDRTGLDGESRLMFEYIRAIRDIRPRWLLWENVPGVLSVDGGRAFGLLIDSLEELGYGVAWRTLDAQFFGLAQRRKRVFVVGHLGDMRAAAVLFERESVSGNTQSDKQKRAELAARDDGRPAAEGRGAGGVTIQTRSDVAPTLTARYDGSAHDAGEAPVVMQTDHLGQNGAIASSDVCKTLDTASAPPVVCMSSIRQNASVDTEICGALMHGDAHPVVCMESTMPNASVDIEMCGTLDHGNNRPVVVCDPVGALVARDYKGAGNAYIEEGKIVCVPRCSR